MPGVTTAYQTGIHSARPANGAGCVLYSCTTHSLVYRDDGTSWTTFLTLSSSTPDLDAVIAASGGQDIADALSGAASPTAGNVFATMADVGGGGAPDPIQDVFGTPSTSFEFASSSLTGLTAMGTATAEDADTTIPGHYYVKKAATSSVALTGRYAAIPGAYPWTAITKVSGFTPYGANFIRYGGLFIGESTPGKVDALHAVFNSNPVWEAAAYTNPTTFSATIGTDRIFQGMGGPLWYGIVANSTTSFDYYFSRDGYVWIKHTAARNPGFTVAVCGILVDPEQTVFAAVAAFDFLRFWNSAKTFPFG